MYKFLNWLFPNEFKGISFFLLFFTVITVQSVAQNLPQSDRIQTRLDSTEAGELILEQTFTVDVPVERVWKFFTQADLYSTWAAPVVEIELKINGTIRANYDPGKTLNDDGTIITNILNYIPEKLITLQAEVPESFPYFMKQYQDDFYNVIEFDSAGKQQTTVTSYGLGYQNTERFRKMMNFFAKGNMASYKKLIEQIEGETEATKQEKQK